MDNSERFDVCAEALASRRSRRAALRVGGTGLARGVQGRTGAPTCAQAASPAADTGGQTQQLLFAQSFASGTWAPKVYLASPLGFATSTRPYMEQLQQELSVLVTVANPWDDHRFDDALASAQAIEDRQERLMKLATVNAELGRANEARIRECDGMVAVLDGVDVDSGTASEMGFAYALGKRVFGLRTDFRLTGDNEASLVNLQVRYWIDASGGTAATSLGELRDAIAAWTTGAQEAVGDEKR